MGGNDFDKRVTAETGWGAKFRACLVVLRLMLLASAGAGGVYGVQSSHATQPDADEVEAWEQQLHHVAMVTHPPMNETSGLIRSQTYPNVWWAHNDSGDQARLFAINAKGQVIMPAWRGDTYYAQEFLEGKAPWPGITMLNSANVDWEDIALHEGQLYIADVGNNGNARRDLGFYVVNEPNPEAIDQGARPISFIPVAYPDQDAYPPKPPTDWRFDCEAVFFHNGRLHLLTKYRADGRWDKIAYGTSLYRLDTTHTDRVNTLTLISQTTDLPIIPTAADLSPDGQRLAVLSYDGVWVFQLPDDSDDWLAGTPWRLALPPHQLKQAEGLCWDDDQTLRIANEQRDIFTLDAGLLKPIE